MRRTLLTAAISSLLAVPLLVAPLASGSAAAAEVATDQVHPMPGKGRITIVGHGYGHGHGMSQYGAEGAARAGLGWKQIVGFYYPGTKVERRASPLKVLISADTSPDVVVSARSHLSVRNHRTGKDLTLPAKGTGRWRLVAGKPDRTRVEHSTRSGWKLWRSWAGTGSFFANRKPIKLHLGSTTRRYRGRLIAAIPRAGSKDRDTVNLVGLDSYVQGVIPAEMPASWSPAAVRAQAVAARSYASYEKAHPRARHYQICDTTACQVYGGRDAEHPLANKAVRATRGRILTKHGKPAFTQFNASSGGWTAAGGFDYLPARKDPYDGWSGNANHTWRVRVDVARIERAWPAVGNLKAIKVTRRDGNGQWKGRIRSMTLIGSKKRVKVSGDDFRFALGLRSTWLTFRS